MIVDICFYRRYDSDLLSLMEYGYDLGALCSEALSHYAAMERVKYHLDHAERLDINEYPTRYRVQFAVNDEGRKAVLKNVSRGYRTQFVKHLVRDMFDASLLGTFLLDTSYEDERLGTEEDIVPASPPGKEQLKIRKPPAPRQPRAMDAAGRDHPQEDARAEDVTVQAAGAEDTHTQYEAVGTSAQPVAERPADRGQDASADGPASGKALVGEFQTMMRRRR